MKPSNDLKPPSCFPVTFDPVNSTFDVSGEIRTSVPFALKSARTFTDDGRSFEAVLFAELFVELFKSAFGLFAAGS